MRPEALNEVDTPADLSPPQAPDSELPNLNLPESNLRGSEPLDPCLPRGNGALRTLRRIVIVLTGFVVLLVGVAMLVLPGPAIVVIPAGLAILATEFLWARKILQRIKSQKILQQIKTSITRGRQPDS